MVNPELDKVWLIRLPVPGAKPDKLGELGEQVALVGEERAIRLDLRTYAGTLFVKCQG